MHDNTKIKGFLKKLISKIKAKSDETYATIDSLSNKQDVLVSGDNIKKINGQDIVGAGNIIIDVEGDVTRAEVEQIVDTKVSLEVINRNAAIEQAISNLINNSPQALDTLYELAQALGNDPNFATTIINLVNEKYNEAIAYADKKYSPTNLPNKVKDKYNNAETFMAYSKEILAKDVTYLGAWNGYELQAIHRNQFVCTSVGQGLSDSEKTMARNNIGAMPYISINGGLMAESSSSDWGVNIGTQVAGWNDTSGGSFKFKKDCPNAGQISLVIDGTVYVNEGQDRVYCSSYLPSSVRDTGNNAETTFAYSKEGLPVDSTIWLAAWNSHELRAIHKDDLLDYHLLKNKPTLHYVSIANQDDDVTIYLLIPDYGDNGIAAVEDILAYFETIGDAYIMCSGYGNQGNDIYVGIQCFGDGKVRLNTASGQIRTFGYGGFINGYLEFNSVVLNY